MNSAGKYLALFILIVSMITECNSFWINLQKIYMNFRLNNGTVIGKIFNNTDNVNTVNSTGPCLSFDHAKSPPYVTSTNLTVRYDSLCEQNAILNITTNNYTCPCEWGLAGSFCYQFQSTTTTCQVDLCNPGKLAVQHENIFANWSQIQKISPIVRNCPYGFIFYDYNYCISKIRSATDWVSAEKNCISSKAHLPSFYSMSDYSMFQTVVSSILCNNTQNLWLGYNSYAWNNVTYAATSYITEENYIDSNLIGNGTCVAYSTKNKKMYLNDCQQSKAYTCLIEAAPDWCPVGWIYIKPYCYKMLDNSSSFSYIDGDKECNIWYNKSHVASFHSQADWDQFQKYRVAFVNRYDINGHKDFENMYIGYQYNTSNGWLYEDGTDPSYANWLNPPSNPTGIGPFCAMSAKSQQYKWIQTDCNTKRGIVCKGPTNQTCNDPTYEFVDGECYKYLTVPATTWAQAARLCNSNGGTLPIFSPSLFYSSSAAQKWQSFLSWRLSNANPQDNIWIGAAQIATEKTFIWMNTRATDKYNDLKSFFGTNPYTTDLYILSSKSNNYTWSTVDATVQANVICHYQKIVKKCPSNEWYALPCTPDPSKNQWCYDCYSCFNCYLPADETLSFVDGENYCQNKSNVTHVIDYYTASEWQEYQNLHYIFLAMEYPYEDVWVGFSRGPQNQTGPWIPTKLYPGDIYVPNYIWSSNEPNGIVNDGNNYCAYHHNIHNVTSGLWYDVSCSSKRGVVCNMSTTETLSCPTSYVPLNGTGTVICYKLYNVPQTFITAFDLCMNDGGNLSSFHSSEEYEDFMRFRWVQRNLDRANDSYSVWIGLQDSTSLPLTWQWTDKTNYNWSAWYSGRQPINSYKPNCVISFSNRTESDIMPWVTDDCNKQHAFICQIRLLALPLSPCSIGWSDVNGDGNCYQIRPTIKNVSYSQAQLYCQSINGTLPSFYNLSDLNNFLTWRTNFGDALNMNTTDFWIGLTNPNVDFSKWSWLDGTIFNDFLLWDPMSNMPQINSNATCVASIELASNTWQNLDCKANMKSVICKEHSYISPCGLGWFQIGDICYNTGSLDTVTNALDSCMNLGGNLPSFHYDAEWADFINYIWLAQVKYSLDISNGLWIGLQDIDMPLVWQWTDGTNYNWSNWQIGVEPNLDTSKSCVIVVKTDKNTYEWRRQACSAVSGYICQKRLRSSLSTCGVGWSDVHGDGNCYQIRPEANNLTYAQSLIYCQSLIGTLPSFTSQSDWNNFQYWRANFGTALNLNTTDFWIGLTSPDSSFTQWSWLDGTLFGFNYWDQNMPQKNSQFPCVASIQSASNHWQNFDCSSAHMKSLICKQDNSSSLNSSAWFQIEDVSYSTVSNASYDIKSNGISTCLSLGGILPSFHSDEEWNDFVAYIWLSEMRFGLKTTDGVWIGLEDTEMPFVWQWNDRTSYNWTNWDIGVEPSTSTELSCVTANKLTLGNYVWRRQTCNAQAGFVCQKRTQLGSSNCKPGWSEVGTRCYQIIPLLSTINFFDANRTCNELNGTLPSFDNASQWELFLMWKSNFANARLLNTLDIWLGAQFNNKSFTWEWTDSIVTSFSNWLNWNTVAPNNNQCVASISAANMQWVGSDCYTTLPSLICQLIQYPVDCQMTAWINGSCSETCGNNLRMPSTRTIAQINLNGGVACPADILVFYDCLDQQPCAIDCEMSNWKNTTCPDQSSCDAYAKMNSSREIVQIDLYGGKPCPNDTFNIYDCPLNPVCQSIYEQSGLKWGLNDSQAKLAIVQDTIPYLIASMSLADKLLLGHQLNETVKTCLYSQQFCNMDRDFKTDYDPSLGNCFTFNFPNSSFYSVDRSGEMFGAKMLIYSSQDQYIFSSKDAGFRVYIRNSTYYSFTDNMGYSIPIGQVSAFALRQTKSLLLSQPYGNCVPDGNKEEDYFYSGTFASEGCYRSCYQKHVVSFCGCGDPRYNLPPNASYCPVSKKICVDYMNSCDNGTDFPCNCAMPCLETSYLPTITKIPIGNSAFIIEYCKHAIDNYTECVENAKNNFAVLQVFFEQLNQISFVEVPSYSLLIWFNDVSNALGLCLGIAAIFLAEIVGAVVAIFSEKYS